MKTLLSLTVAALTLATFAAPTLAAISATGFDVVATDTVVDRRKPRVPGGSGCDDPRDLIEHPECRR